ncbi:hypothetical protein V6Z12_A13G072800 [Gossypium hirsutum]
MYLTPYFGVLKFFLTQLGKKPSLPWLSQDYQITSMCTMNFKNFDVEGIKAWFNANQTVLQIIVVFGLYHRTMRYVIIAITIFLVLDLKLVFAWKHPSKF